MGEKSGETAASDHARAAHDTANAIREVDPRLANIRKEAKDQQYCGALVLAYELAHGRRADVVQGNICTRRLPGQGLRACQRAAWWLPDEQNLVTSRMEYLPEGETSESGLPWQYVQTVGCPVLRRCGRPIKELETGDGLEAAVDEAVPDELIEKIGTEVATGGSLTELPATEVATFPPHLDPLAPGATKL